MEVKPAHRMGSAQIFLKLSAWIAGSETYQLIPLSIHLFSHWSIPLEAFREIRVNTCATNLILGQTRIRCFYSKPPPPFCSWPSIFETNTRNRDCRIFKPNSILHTRTRPSLLYFPSTKLKFYTFTRFYLKNLIFYNIWTIRHYATQMLCNQDEFIASIFVFLRWTNL